MQWTVHGHRDVYDSSWVRVSLDDVEIPGGPRFEHHVLHFPRASVTTVITDGKDRVLLLWRHRFITDSWGWEVPAGWAETGEDPEAAARREAEEETGWRPGQLHVLAGWNALSGISDMRFTAFTGEAAEYVGAPADAAESSMVEWIPLADVPKLAAAGHIQDGPSLTSLAYYLAIGRHG